MASQKDDKIRCPCCNMLKGINEVSELINHYKLVMPAGYKINFKNFRPYGIWACDLCINEKKAIKSDPFKMNFTVLPRYFAYIKRKLVCDDCNVDFEFSAKEQQHWFEELGFWHESMPRRCITCRKQIREQRNLNTELSDLMRNLNKDDFKQLQRISEIYEQMGKAEKVKEYNTLARKALNKNVKSPNN